jgi:flagellar basal body-associated protein FliL
LSLSFSSSSSSSSSENFVMLIIIIVIVIIVMSSFALARHRAWRLRALQPVHQAESQRLSNASRRPLQSRAGS